MKCSIKDACKCLEYLCSTQMQFVVAYEYIRAIILSLAESNRNRIKYHRVDRNDRSIEIRDDDII